VRLALRDDAVVVDECQRLPGRGAYVCGRDCLRAAATRGRLRASFRRAVSIDPQTVESVG
jgi:predicted RNA-binding protein YlxR (DUF448 family)